MSPTRISFVVAVVAALASLAGAGPLDPPSGPIVPTGKTLAEVEPRIAVNAVNTPGTGAATFRITQPGSYYLTGNVLGQDGKYGILISANGVTLDLMGFAIIGTAGALDGIRMDAFRENVVIRNGHVRDWPRSGIDVAIDIGRIEGIVASDNGGWGISNGSGGQFTTTITDCEAFRNGSQVPGTGNFRGFDSTRISRCTSFEATGTGILVQQSSIVELCLVVGSTEDGISAGPTSTVRWNTVTGCDRNGIVVNNDSRVTENVCDQNGAGAADGANILVIGTDNRIEGNTCTDADRGIDVDVAGNFIARNTCSGNSVNWDIAAGNICFVVSALVSPAFSGSAGGTPPGSADPNANFSF